MSKIKDQIPIEEIERKKAELTTWAEQYCLSGQSVSVWVVVDFLPSDTSIEIGRSRKGRSQVIRPASQEDWEEIMASSLSETYLERLRRIRLIGHRAWRPEDVGLDTWNTFSSLGYHMRKVGLPFSVRQVTGNGNWYESTYKLFRVSP